MANITASELRRLLEGQRFRVKDVDDQTWEVKAPEDADLSQMTIPSGIVRIHHHGLRREDSRWTAIMSDLDPGQLLDAVELAVTHHAERKAPMRAIADYAPDNVSKKVVRIILSYTDYVNRTVWRR